MILIYYVLILYFVSFKFLFSFNYLYIYNIYFNLSFLLFNNFLLFLLKNIILLFLLSVLFWFVFILTYYFSKKIVWFNSFLMCFISIFFFRFKTSKESSELYMFLLFIYSDIRHLIYFSVSLSLAIFKRDGVWRCVEWENALVSGQRRLQSHNPVTNSISAQISSHPAVFIISLGSCRCDG